MKKFIFFRNDRLGDFLIITNLIKAVKIKYPKSKITVISSKFNNHFIKKYKIIDDVILYDKNFSFFKKIKILKRLLIKTMTPLSFLMGNHFHLCVIYLLDQKKISIIL